MASNKDNNNAASRWAYPRPRKSPNTSEKLREVADVLAKRVALTRDQTTNSRAKAKINAEAASYLTGLSMATKRAYNTVKPVWNPLIETKFKTQFRNRLSEFNFTINPLYYHDPIKFTFKNLGAFYNANQFQADTGFTFQDEPSLTVEFEILGYKYTSNYHFHIVGVGAELKVDDKTWKWKVKNYDDKDFDFIKKILMIPSGVARMLMNHTVWATEILYEICKDPLKTVIGVIEHNTIHKATIHEYEQLFKMFKRAYALYDSWQYLTTLAKKLVPKYYSNIGVVGNTIRFNLNSTMYIEITIAGDAIEFRQVNLPFEKITAESKVAFSALLLLLLRKPEKELQGYLGKLRGSFNEVIQLDISDVKKVFDEFEKISEEALTKLKNVKPAALSMASTIKLDVNKKSNVTVLTLSSTDNNNEPFVFRALYNPKTNYVIRDCTYDSKGQKLSLVNDDNNALQLADEMILCLYLLRSVLNNQNQKERVDSVAKQARDLQVENIDIRIANGVIRDCVIELLYKFKKGDGNK